VPLTRKSPFIAPMTSALLGDAQRVRCLGVRHNLKRNLTGMNLIIELLKLLGVIAPFANAPEACALPSVRP